MAFKEFFKNKNGNYKMGHLISFLVAVASLFTIGFGIYFVYAEIFLQQGTAFGVALVSLGLGEGLASGGMEAYTIRREND